MMYFWLILGLITLIIAGEFLVRGAVGIAKKFHISSLVIGMTVISFGTSAPEFIVSVQSALNGHPDIAIGNVVGSNIANITIVLGITVLILPLIVDRNTKIIDYPVMLLASALFVVFAIDGQLQNYEGCILFTVLIGFTYFLIRNSRRKTKKLAAEADENTEDIAKIKDKPALSTLFVLVGLTGLFFGAEWLVTGAIDIAKTYGMEERIIGVTVVAFGTSVPELITSAVAAIKGEADIAIGNLIGSNIFNILGVLGVSAMITPVNVSDSTISGDMLWMVGIAVGMLPILFLGKKIGRLKGAVLTATYILYVAILIINMDRLPV